jgi:hypothetical protein
MRVYWAWLRDRQIPVLAVWGRNDEIFRHLDDGPPSSAPSSSGPCLSYTVLMRWRTR